MRILILSNESTQGDADMVAAAFALSNDAGSKKAPEWIEIPYGQHDHKEAMQVFDSSAASEIVSNFQAEQKASGKKFKGLPIYLYHADDPRLAGPNPDKRARGWIRQMEVSNDGLRIKTDWNALGRSEVEGEEVAYFSPRWGVRRIANTARSVRPVHLLSVGLTNEPNIGVMPLTNERTTPMKITPEVRKKLGLAEDATPEVCTARIDQFLLNAKEPPASDKPAPLPPWIHEIAGTNPDTADDAAVKDALSKHAADSKAIDDVKKARDKVQDSHSKLDQAHKALEQKMSNELARAEAAEGKAAALQAALANERKTCATLAAEKAVREGRLRQGEAAARIETLSNSGDKFGEQVAALATAPVIVPITRELMTASLGQRKEGAEDLQGKILTLVNERMTKTGCSYDDAWLAVKKEHKGLMDQMQQPQK